MAQAFRELDSGSATFEDLVDKVFYGVRVDSRTGHAYVDIIAGDATIALPDPAYPQPTDYVNWMFSYSTFSFSFNNSNGHLLVEVY